MRPAAALLLALLLAGCAREEPGGDPDPALPATGASAPSAEECAALAARAPSGNAPALAFFAQDESEVAARLAEALEDPLLSREPRGPTGGFTGHRFPDAVAEWETREGYIELLVGDGSRAWRYWGQRSWAPLDAQEADAAFHDVLRALGMPVETLADPQTRLSDDGQQRRVDGAAAQTRAPRGLTLSGHAYGSPGADFWVVRDEEGGDRSQFTLRVMHDLANATTSLTSEEVARIATLAARCHLAEEPHALATLQPARTASDEPFLQGESVAYAASVAYQETPEPCHGMRILTIAVDAVTGAVLRAGPPGAGCVT